MNFKWFKSNVYIIGLELGDIQFFHKLQTFNTSANLLCDLILCDST